MSALSVAAATDRLISWTELAPMIGGVDPATVYRWEKQGLFPRRIKLSSAGGRSGRVAWSEAEIRGWLEERRAQRAGAAP
jgi:predicted DNA-binding transcriptional regulator AlpA